MSRMEADKSQASAFLSRPNLPHAFFLDVPHGGQRFCLFHPPRPSAPERGRVLFCPPFAEELNTTRCTAARQARALAEAGFAVMQIDLLGCGDSSGDFADATWPAWLADLQLAHAWLSERQPASKPLWLWGLRAGALLASDLAATLPEPTNLLLWQPFTSGQQQLQQFLRLHSASQWLAGDQADAVRKTDKPAQQLAQGQTVHIAGYPLSPLLAQGLSAAKLQPPTHHPPGQLIWLEFSSQANPDRTEKPVLLPPSAKQIDGWQQVGWQATAQIVTTPAFWQTVETEAAPQLFDATLVALKAQDPTEADATAPRPPPHQGASPAPKPTNSPGGAAPHEASFNERAITIPGPVSDMLGIVSLSASHQPSATHACASVGVVIVVGGAQYRTGSHRQFTGLARHLAAHGHPVLRFDFPGMGDSPGDWVGFESTAPHIAATIDAFQTTCPSVKRVVLWGLCDGASASLLYWGDTQDPRVVGLALLNPWIRSEAGLARAQVKHYYRLRLMEPDFWRKLLVGDVGWKSVRALGKSLRAMRSHPPKTAATTFQARMAQAWREFQGPILLLLSERDLTAHEFMETAATEPTWRDWDRKPLLQQLMLPMADHTCSATASGQQVQKLVLQYLRRALDLHPLKL